MNALKSSDLIRAATLTSRLSGPDLKTDRTFGPIVKILLGTHHLEKREGSELFTAELAHSIQARGHEVAVFTFFKGKIAELIEANDIPVFSPDNATAMARFTPDIVQTCHLPCAHFLRSVVPDAIWVHAMLGVIPSLEAPPLDGGAFSLGLAVSEEVVDRINQTSFGRDVDTAIFRNWFDDKAVMTSARALKSHGRLRVAVISNHIAPELIDALAALEAAGGVEVDYFGVQRRSVVVDGRFLAKYDLVISIGRTSLLAAACGVPCIMADIHGSDGLLTVDNLDHVRTVNFSGRLQKHPITKTHVQEEIDKLRSHDREQLRNRIAVEYSLASRTEWLLARFEGLLADRRNGAQKFLRNPSIFEAPGEGLVYAEITGTVRELRKQLEAAQQQIETAQQEIAALGMLGIPQRIRRKWKQLSRKSPR